MAHLKSEAWEFDDSNDNAISYAGAPLWLLGITRRGSRCAQALVPVGSASCLASTCQLPESVSFIINCLKALILLLQLDHPIIQITPFISNIMRRRTNSFPSQPRTHTLSLMACQSVPAVLHL